MDFRSFSGFDLARLVRNFEINASSDSGLNQLRATAVGLYLVPALAANAVVLAFLSVAAPSVIPVARAAAIAAGAYALLVLSIVLVLSQVPINGFATVAGTPSWGFVATAAGAALLVWLGTFVRALD